MLKRALLTVAALTLPAAPASAQMREAALPEIFESYNDCFAATESGAISIASLESNGWARASMSDGDGEKVEGGPIIYGHTERAPLIILNETEGAGVCMVNARIKSFKVFEEFKAAFGDRLPKPDDEGSITFFADGQAVQMAPTGSREAPALRVAVLTPRKSS
ncbi:hypothetical protein [Qipengyuania qiaonensis]|uniref:Uncharacterized protein n=1 Tax=Qipengyuania qiaonensis TaxID=2867240 RepID=A0ABS7JA12_9SPHN|nr:hypothetical protein [Qipengyuania qiaonensis]MBX7482699.1 hypothetical protein [Qipengyuania qiaonensis]